MAGQKLIIIFIVGLIAIVAGKPLSPDVFEARDDLNPKPIDVVKRQSNDVAELSGQKISLAALIDNIESGLFQTALSVGNVASDPNAQVQEVTSHRTINKRSTTEEDDSVTSSPIVLVQTTEKVEAADAVPAHVVIDRVSVYKAPTDGALLFPTFHLHEAIVSSETGDVVGEHEENAYVVTTVDGGSSEESSDSTESNQSSSSSSEQKTSSSSTSTTTSSSSSVTPTPSPSPTTVKGTSTSPAPSTTSASSTSTTHLPANDKESAEKELKEKVAEVEADPVILTARV